MTIAAVILAASVESALADAAGVSRVRRIADAAWSGGALPIIVVAPDPDGTVAAALAGAPVTLAAPVAANRGPVGQIARGIDVAVAEIGETTAAIIWPARLCWAGPETVTSLVEAHGRSPDALLRPTFHGDPGWPVLLPLAALEALRALAPNRMPDALIDAIVTTGLPLRTIDLGDPGTVIDGGIPLTELPPYEGPATPGGTNEWGSAAAATAEDAPLEGPEVAAPELD